MAATHNQDKLDLPKLIEHELFDSVTLAAKYFVSILDEHRSGEVCRDRDMCKKEMAKKWPLCLRGVRGIQEFSLGNTPTYC